MKERSNLLIMRDMIIILSMCLVFVSILCVITVFRVTKTTASVESVGRNKNKDYLDYMINYTEPEDEAAYTDLFANVEAPDYVLYDMETNEDITHTGDFVLFEALAYRHIVNAVNIDSNNEECEFEVHFMYDFDFDDTRITEQDAHKLARQYLNYLAVCFEKASYEELTQEDALYYLIKELKEFIDSQQEDNDLITNFEYCLSGTAGNKYNIHAGYTESDENFEKFLSLNTFDLLSKERGDRQMKRYLQQMEK